MKIRHARSAAVLSAAVLLGFASPALAVYTVQWSNGGVSYVCDNGTVYAEEGDTTGTPFISGYFPGQGPC